jgi:DNA replication and repair protein RecF
VVRRVKLYNFRNYSRKQVDFERGINIVIGKNGQGKTNLLEALFFLLQGKSMRTSDAKEMIKRGEEEALVEGIVDEGREVRLRLVIGKEGNVKGRRTAGGLEAVSFQPDDIWMVKGGPEVRRKNLDEVVTGLKKGYKETLREYQRILKQRNEAIKAVRRGTKRRDYIRTWNPLLLQAGVNIVEERTDAIKKIGVEMAELGKKWGKEKTGIKYYTTMGSEEWGREKGQEKIERMEEAEVRRGATLIGPHRDELLFTLGEKNVRRECSQGEQKMVVIMWTLAQARMLNGHLGREAILLMDDCLSELDEENRGILMGELRGWRQVVVTSTDDLREFEGLRKITIN